RSGATAQRRRPGVRPQPPQRQRPAQRPGQGPDPRPRPRRANSPDQDPRSPHCLVGPHLQLPEGGPPVTIAPALLHAYPAMNKAQREIVTHDQGPLLVIAGPGSGKTFSLVLRGMNLLLLEKAAPHELVICTFTEKAAFE